MGFVSHQPNNLLARVAQLRAYLPAGFTGTEGSGFLPNSPTPVGDSLETMCIQGGNIWTGTQCVFPSDRVTSYPSVPDPLAPIGEVTVVPKPSDVLPSGYTTRGYANLDVTPACALLSEPYKTACMIAAGAVGYGPTTVGQTFTANPGSGGAVSCPSGYHMDASGKCVIDGWGAYLPGDIGKPDVAWNPVAGRYGVGSAPVLVQANRLACPPGFKLGKDEVCYEHLTHKERKWNPGTRPLLTGGEVHAMQKARSVEKRLKKYATKHLPKACRCSTTKRKK